MPPSSLSSPDRAARGRLVVLSGPSGVGKSTVVAALRKRHPFRFSVSVTTRPPRPADVDGVHYRFVDEPTFREMQASGELLESAEFAGSLYGTPRRPVLEWLAEGEDVLLEIEVQGARQIEAAVPDALLIFLRPPSMEVLARRLSRRGDTSDVERRLAIAEREMQAAGEFDHVVVNDRVDRATEEILELITDGR